MFHWTRWRFWSLSLLALVLTGCADRLLIGDPRLRKTPDQYIYETVLLGPYARAWFIPHAEACGTAILLPGYKTNRGYFIEFIDLWLSNKFNVLLLDYRGFGDAAGKVDFRGLVEDTHLAVVYARCKHPTVILHGFSLGTMVEAKVASEVDVTGCVFEGLASPDALGPTGWVLPKEMRTRLTVPKISEPKLFIHSVDDDVTVYPEAHRIYESATEPKMLWTTSGPHILSYRIDPQGYRAVVEQWIGGLHVSRK